MTVSQKLKTIQRENNLKFKNLFQDEEGNMSFDVATSPDEVAYLVNYAVADLLREGVISVNGLDEQDVVLRGTEH